MVFKNINCINFYMHIVFSILQFTSTAIWFNHLMLCSMKGSQTFINKSLLFLYLFIFAAGLQRSKNNEVVRSP